VNKVTIHHESPPIDEPNIHSSLIFDGINSIRYLQKQHIEKNGFPDIKFHYIIAPCGTVYEGVPPEMRGFHVAKNNSGNIGILVIGNFTVEIPKAEQMISLKILLRHICEIFPSYNSKETYGHRDFIFTKCPGDNLYSEINKIKWGEVNIYEDN
jgi:hypothetical protein